MDIPAASVCTELEVRRSRFIATLTPVEDRDSAEDEIDRRRREHPHANHIVYAFIVGAPKSTVSGMSDDGEPKGTAGRPVMEILKGSNLTNAALTVVRYFGGTKLGTGGLVRAYSDAARAALALADRVPHRVLSEYFLHIPYEIHQPVMTILTEAGAEIRRERYHECVTVQIALEAENAKRVDQALADVSRGTLVLSPDPE